MQSYIFLSLNENDTGGNYSFPPVPHKPNFDEMGLF